MYYYQLSKLLRGLATGVALVGVVVFILHLYFKITHETPLQPQKKVQQPVTKNTKQQEFIPYSEREWLIYKDNHFHYVIKYPSGLGILPTPISTSTPSIEQERLIENGGVSFTSFGLGVMGVKVYTNTNFTSVEDWLVFKNNKIKLIQAQVLEKRIRIDGYEALVTYPKGALPPYEEFPYAKRTVFIKGDVLFEIWTNFKDENEHQRVWDSFKFLQ